MSSHPRLQTVAPVFFTYDQSGSGYAVRHVSDWTVTVGPIGLLGSGNRNSAGKPGDCGGSLDDRAGSTSPAYPEGRLVTSRAPGQRRSRDGWGGVQALVDWAGVVGGRLYQVNIHVPSLSL